MSTPITARPLPPPLENPCPPCSICGETTEYDGAFYCAGCGCSWDSELSHLDGHSSWNDPELPQCPATVRPYKGDAGPYLSKVVYRCLLSENHDDQRRGTCDRGDDIHEWTDDDTDGYLSEVLRETEYLARVGAEVIVAEIHASAEALGIPAT